MKLISVILTMLFISACANHQNIADTGSNVELYGVIDGGIGVQKR